MVQIKIWCLYNPEILFANSILIEGDEGVIVVDTGISRKAGEYINKKLKELTDKPVKAIIYTHHHYDHINGTEVLVSKEEVEQNNIPIFAAKNFILEHTSENIVTGPIMAWRAMYGYGAYLEPEEAKEYIIGGMMAKPSFGETAHIVPNRFVDEILDINLLGVKLHIFQTGGEAASEMVIYLPEEKILLCADEIYPSNPNLHSIRGTKPRDARKWIEAIDKMRQLEIEHLVGNHGKPVVGREVIQEILVYYRDIIQYQHDQAVRYINKGYTQKELAERLQKLPEYLEYPPYSKNFYGHISHNIPEFFVGYISWFSGDPVELNPTPLKESAKRIIKMMGGREKIFAEAEKAFFANEPQFAAELTTLLIRIDNEDVDARQLKAACFRKLGYQQINSWWRAWYLTSALELEGNIDIPTLTQERMAMIRNIEFVKSLSIEQIYNRFRYCVNPKEAGNKHLIVGFEFKDTKEEFAMELRHSILEYLEVIPKDCDAVLIMDRSLLNKIMAKQETIVGAILKRKISIKGKKKLIQEFFKCLDLEMEPLYMSMK
ncbi:MAG: alkyl sulfatase dimerization domain-containing protein [Candidatus Heimdallarchaeota archaeon]